MIANVFKLHTAAGPRSIHVVRPAGFPRCICTAHKRDVTATTFVANSERKQFRRKQTLRNAPPSSGLPGFGVWGYEKGWTYDEELEKKDIDLVRRLEQGRLDRRIARALELPPTPTVVTRLPDHLGRSTLANAMFLVDKPPDWDAPEVLRAMKWALKVKKIAHTGSIEPIGTGLMLILVNDATVFTRTFHDLDKQYTGIIRLGLATDTGDATGKGVESLPWSFITDEQIQAAAARLHGEVMQVQPLQVTTVKIFGKPVPKSISKAHGLDLTPEPVYVRSFKAWREPGSKDINFQLTLGRAAFVRSIAHEFGRMLGTCSHLAALRREALGGFSVQDAWTLDVLLPVIRKFGKSVRDK